MKVDLSNYKYFNMPSQNHNYSCHLLLNLLVLIKRYRETIILNMSPTAKSANTMKSFLLFAFNSFSMSIIVGVKTSDRKLSCK